MQDLRIQIRGRKFHHFTVNLAENEQYATRLTYDRDQNQLTLDRSHAGMPEDKIPVRYVRLPEENDTIDLRILMDRYSVEIFACDGRIALTEAIFTPQNADGISLETDGTVYMDIISNKIAV